MGQSHAGHGATLMPRTPLGPPPFRAKMLNKDGLMEATSLWGQYTVDQQTQNLNAAPADGAYLVATSSTALTDAINLGALTTGYLSITVALGVATVSSSATVSAATLTGTLPDAVFPATLPAVSGVNLTSLTGANVNHSVVTKTFADTGYVASADQTVLVNATGGATTIKVPGTPTSGKFCIVKKIDASANAVTVDGNGHNIDGAATQALPAQWNAFTMQADGSNWYVTGQV